MPVSANGLRRAGSITHLNLVILLGVCLDPEHPAIVYEFLENGSLYDLLFSVSSKVSAILTTTFCSMCTHCYPQNDSFLII